MSAHTWEPVQGWRCSVGIKKMCGAPAVVGCRKVTCTLCGGGAGRCKRHAPRKREP